MIQNPQLDQLRQLRIDFKWEIKIIFFDWQSISIFPCCRNPTNSVENEGVISVNEVDYDSSESTKILQH